MVMVIGGGRTSTPSPSRRRTGTVGINSQTILGRHSSGTGLQEVLTPQKAREVLNLWESNDVFFNSLRLSNTSNNIAGTIQWDGTDFLGYNGTQWKSLTNTTGIDTKTVSASYDNNTSTATFNRDDGTTFTLDLGQLVVGAGINLTDLSVLPKPPASGDGHLGYDNTTGEFTYTPPDLSGYLTSYTETDPVFTAHTSSDISSGTGFLKNDGSGNWSYDNNTYLTSSDLSYYTDSDVNTLLNISSAGNNQILSWNGTDYAWINQSSGGSGISLTDLSILPESTPSGDGHLGYDNTTGEFTYTPPDLSGYLTSYTETDPVFSASAAASITNTKITNWDTAHGWGDHSTAGYLTSYTETSTLDDVVTRGNTTTTTAVIPFLYSNQSSFPNAATYHGAIAHSHADGAMYFAHGGNWVKLANDSQLANSSNWDTAYGWGDHSAAGYVLTSNLDYYTDSDVDARLDSDLAGDGQILSWDDTNSNYVWIDSPTFTETVTSLNINANILTYTREDGTTDQYDLSLYLDDTNLARITSGTLDASTGIATFTRDDSSTFTLDLSSLLNITFADLSVVKPNPAASGSGDLTYDNTTGEFTYTPPDLSGYLTSYTETDPVFSASAAASITNTKITNWDTAHGWGDHSAAGYLTSFSETVTSLSLSLGSLLYTDEGGTVTNIPLTSYENQVLSVNGYVGTVNLTKGDIGLGNVDNTSDVDKPISTLTQTALDLKVNYTDVLTTVTSTNKIVTQSDISSLGGGDMLKNVYDTNNSNVVDNAEKVNGFTVGIDVPANAVFTDTVYTDSDVDSHLNQTNPTSGHVLSWNGSDYAWVAQSSGYSNTDVDAHLNQTGSITDGYVLSWDTTTGDYSWINKGNTLLNISDNVQGVVLGAGKKLQTNDIEMDVGSTLSAAGCIVDFSSSTIIGLGGEIKSEIDTHLNVTPTNPTDGYVLSWDTSANAGQGDFVWVAKGNTLSNIVDTSYGVDVTGKMQISTIDIGSGINASAGATFDLQGTTINFGSATIMGGNAFNGTINNHLWSGSTAPTDGYILSWNSSLLSGAGDYEWVAQSSSGIVLTDLSVGTPNAASGSGGLAYDDTTGIFTYTPPDLSGYVLTSNLDYYTDSDVDARLDSDLAGDGQILSWDDTNSKYVWIDSPTFSETTTSLTLTNGNLVYTDEDGTQNSISLAAYLDEDSRSIASGVLDSVTGIVTFTRDDNSTFTLDLSALLDDTNLVTSVNGQNGVVVLSKSDIGLGNVDNTSDADKPISTATQTALDLKVNYTDVLSTVTSTNKIVTQSDIPSLTETDTLDDVVTRGNTTTTTAVIPFLYANQSSFPNASTYHGAIAHSHADGAMYFAHNSIWNKLANDSQLANSPNWDTAHGWGNHANAGYLTSYTETDPVFSASAAASITNTKITNWDTAHGWGDHSAAGYSNVTSSDSAPTSPSDNDLWWDSDEGVLKIRYNDGSSQQWVDISSSSSGGIALTDLSVGTPNAASSSGAISYDNTTGEFTYTPPDLSGYLTSETSHADVLVDGDFSSSGLMKTDGSGVYSTVTDNSSNWDTAYGWGDHSTVGYLTSFAETVTSLSVLNNILTYTKEDGTTDTVDLSLYLDDTNLARITSGTLNSSTGIATFTRDDNSTFTLDLSSLLNITFADLSVVKPNPSASGSGDLTYDNTTGEFTFTPPDLSGFAASSDISWVVSGNDIYSSNSGNVGIGTTTPLDKLEVSGGIRVSDSWSETPSSSGVIDYISSNISNITRFISQGDSENRGQFKFVNQNSVGSSILESVFINSYGDVGLGVDNIIEYYNTSNPPSLNGSGVVISNEPTYLNDNHSAKYGRSISVSSDGNVLAVAAHQGTTAQTNGLIYIYTKQTDGTWSLRDTIINPSDGDPTEYEFGVSVSLSSDGNLMAVGSYDLGLSEGYYTGHTSTQYYRSGVHIYEYSNSSWGIRDTILDPKASPSLEFGKDVALSSDGAILIVGVGRYDNSVYYGEGGVYRFKYDSQNTIWNQEDFITIPHTNTFITGGDNPPAGFGATVSISDDGMILTVGSPDYDSSNATGNTESTGNQGAVYTYIWDLVGQNYISRGSLLELNPEGLNFGKSLCLTGNGNTLVVSSIDDISSASEPRGKRKVHIYDWASTSWSKRNFIMESPSNYSGSSYYNDTYGESLTCSSDGTTLLISSPLYWLTNSSNVTQGTWNAQGIYSYSGLMGSSIVYEKLEVDGAVKISSTTNSSVDAGTIQWNGTDFLGYNGSAWKSLTVPSQSDLSGMDADTVDGLHASSFALANHHHDSDYLGINDTATNSALLDNLDSSQFLRSDVDDHTTGKLGIGSAPVNEKLEVSGAIKIGDTSTVSPSGGEIKYDGDYKSYNTTLSTWESLTFQTSDVDTHLNQSSAVDGQVLSWDDVNAVYNWVDPSSLSITEVNDLSSAVTWADVPDANITQSSVTQHESTLTITESQISDLHHYDNADVNTLLNKTTTSDGKLLTWDQALGLYKWVDSTSLAITESNDLSSVVTWADVPDANITQSSVTQHEGALSILESQITGLNYYTNADVNTLLNKTTTSDGQLLTWDQTAGLYKWITKASLSSSITINKSQITDLGNYVETISGTTNEIEVTGTASSGATFTIGLPDDVVITSDLTVGGNLSVNGTSTRIDSTVTTIIDPVISIGGESTTSNGFADLSALDPKDRGVEFKYWDSTSSSSKLGFIGWDSDVAKFTLLKDATNTNEIFSGTKAELDAGVDWSNILNKPTSAGVDTDTTYSVKASNISGGASLDLDAGGSGSGTDKVNFKHAGATTITYTDDDNIEISSTDTTYSAGIGLSLVLWGGTYTRFNLNKATSATLGGVQLGSHITQTTAPNSPSSTFGRTYPVQFNSSDQLVVNVPWVDTDTTYSAGTGLSLSGANQFSLSKATDAALGGVKLTTTTAQTVGANTASTDAGRTYPVQFNSSDQLVVNVPWTDGSGSLTSSQWTDVTSGIHYSSGNVGIGLSGPSEILNVGIPNNKTVGTLYTTTRNWNDASNRVDLLFKYKYKSDGSYASGSQISLAKESNTVDGHYGSDIRLFTRQHGQSTSEKMRIKGDGNVGIGITSPNYRLQVVDPTVNSSSNVVYPIEVAAFGDASINDGLKIVGASNLEWGLQSLNTRDIIFENNTSGTTSRLMTIKDNGNVGIGNFSTSSPPLTHLHIKDDTSNANTCLRLENGSQKWDLCTRGGDSNKFKLFDATGNKSPFIVEKGITQHNLLYLKSEVVGSADAVDGTDLPNRIGVNTHVPEAELHVEGNLLVDIYDAAQTGGGVFFRSSTSSDAEYLLDKPYNMSILAYDHSNSGASADGLSINAWDGISFCTNSNTRNERMRISKDGNVGIGHTNPLAKLQTNISSADAYSNGNVNLDKCILSLVNDISSLGDTTGAHSTIQFNVNGGTNRNRVGGISFIAEDASVSTGNRKGALTFWTDDEASRTEKLRITGDGNVGIGTNDPDCKLHVSDNIKTDGNIISSGVIEQYGTLGTGATGGGTSIDHDVSVLKLGYFSNAGGSPDMSGDCTVNLFNFDASVGQATNVSYIVQQGSTSSATHIINAMTITTNSSVDTSATVTINWQGGSAPVGTVGGIDVFSFTILRTGTSTYVVLANMVDY